MLDSVTANALSGALDGLALRQRAIADNIANINTPGYQAQRVLFEDALRRAVESGSGVAQPTVERSLEPTRLNGNNVNLDTETLSNIDTVLRFQFASQALSGQAASITKAIGQASA
ncbi:flagellar basal-body rod protein FlgB [Microbacterium keratanolyticum]|uniref:Flagellar basal body rod protein FlgB n=1 Tax=Microbacterium keratanolyticum TaxID=67574 RepID=A0A9W6M8Z8_9MICO|nr:flagellar basal body protein [Microbacterium keratanolyticum]MBM7469535.1 flagellar basal-body rod protein FlgB [Microbacterium keratanolyticum]GLK01614.1 flagellar basal body rod protein FlgB [Microbacterium keratanolyticum]